MKKLLKFASLLFAFVLTGAVLAGCGGRGQPSEIPGGNNPGGNNPGGNEPGGEEEINLADFPLYNEEYETMTYTQAEYEEKMSQPYWLGNVIYNELTLPIQYEDGQAYANLLYKPLKVVSVMDQTLKTTYTEGTDYTIDEETGRILIPAGSSIPLFNEKIITGTTVEEIEAAVPEGFEYTQGMPDNHTLYTIWPGTMGPMVYTESSLFYGRYLSVTYAYDVRDLPEDIFAEYDVTVLNTLRRKLERGEYISMAVLGDSISAGSSSTGDNLNVAPYTPCYANQLAAEIERVYGVNVTLTNSAQGGTVSEWPLTGEGTAALNNAKAAVPDLCVIAYGMNDSTSDVSAVRYRDNIERLVMEIKTASPDCNFILVNSFPCNPGYEKDSGIFNEYLAQLQRIVSDNGNDGSMVVVDMQKVGKYFMEIKNYCEISSSNINHPNDFMHRVYAMNLMQVICDYKG